MPIADIISIEHVVCATDDEPGVMGDGVVEGGWHDISQRYVEIYVTESHRKRGK